MLCMNDSPLKTKTRCTERRPACYCTRWQCHPTACTSMGSIALEGGVNAPTDLDSESDGRECAAFACSERLKKCEGVVRCNWLQADTADLESSVYGSSPFSSEVARLRLALEASRRGQNSVVRTCLRTRVRNKRFGRCLCAVQRRGHRGTPVSGEHPHPVSFLARRQGR